MTTITTIESLDLDLLRAFAMDQIEGLPITAWRHHGAGMLQAYVDQDQDVERRIHVWHPDLVLFSGIDQSGAIHDHRFDMTSRVILGAIGHTVFDPHPSPEGWYETLDLVNARAAQASTGSFHVDPKPTGDRYIASWTEYEIHAGQTYFFPRRTFHASTTRGMAVSVVTKSNQSGTARLLCPRGTPHVNAFGNPENVTDPRVAQLQADFDAVSTALGVPAPAPHACSPASAQSRKEAQVA